MLPALVLLPALFAAAPADAPATTLAVYVDGVRGGGDVVVRLYRSAEGYPFGRREAYREVRLPVEGRTATALLDDVPAGPVAVVVFHDADADGRLRTGPDGRPLDGVGVTGWTGGPLPDFRRAAVEVAPGRVAVARLALRYL